MRIRTITGAVAEIKKHDPNASISRTTIREFIRQGIIPEIRLQKNLYVDLDEIEKLFRIEVNHEERNEKEC